LAGPFNLTGTKTLKQKLQFHSRHVRQNAAYPSHHMLTPPHCSHIRS